MSGNNSIFKKDIASLFHDYNTNLIKGTSLYLLQRNNNILKKFFWINFDALLVTSIVLLTFFLIPLFLCNGFSLYMTFFDISVGTAKQGVYDINMTHGVILVLITMECYIIGCFIIVFAFHCNDEILYDEWDKKLIVNGQIYSIKEIVKYPLCPLLPFGVVNNCFTIYSFKTTIGKAFNCLIFLINNKVINYLNLYKPKVCFVMYILTTSLAILSIFLGVEYTFFAERFRIYPYY